MAHNENDYYMQNGEEINTQTGQYDNNTVSSGEQYSEQATYGHDMYTQQQYYGQGQQYYYPPPNDGYTAGYTVDGQGQPTTVDNQNLQQPQAVDPNYNYQQYPGGYVYPYGSQYGQMPTAVNYQPLPREEDVKLKKDVVNSKGFKATILAFLLSILFVETVLLDGFGIFVPITVVLFYAFIYYVFSGKKALYGYRFLLLSVAEIVISISFALHYNPSNHFIAFVTMILIAGIQLLLVGDVPIKGLFYLSTIGKFFSDVFIKMFAGFDLGPRSLSYSKEKGDSRGNKGKKIALGLVISLPLALILLALFTSADVAFQQVLAEFFKILRFDISRVFIVLIIGALLTCFACGAIYFLKWGKKEKLNETQRVRQLDYTIITTIISVLTAVTGIFVVVQFAYFFRGAVIQGMTYSEYARRGFYELLVASLIVFTASAISLSFTKFKNGSFPSVLRVLLALLCLFDAIIVVSGMSRMFVYISVYGLSINRLITIWIMGVITLFLLWFLLKCIFYNKFKVQNFIGATIIVAVCALCITNTERLVAGYNVDRYIENPTAVEMDIWYLGDLSYTVIPELEKLERSGLVTDRYLFDEIMDEKRRDYENRHSIYGFSFDRIEAGKVLE